MGDVKILDLRPLRGPNFFTRRPVIYMKLDIGPYEDKPTNMIPGFLDRLRARMPSLYEHRCSEDGPGGFFHRVEVGTWFGHVMEHVALEIQTLAEMDTGFGRTRQTKQHGIYNVVFSYIWEQCGMRAGELAVEFTEAVAQDLPFDMDAAIMDLKELRERYMLGPSTGSIVKEAMDRGIPYVRLNDQSLVQLGFGVNQKRVEATITSQTSHIAVELASDKNACKQLLADAGLPVPEGAMVESMREARNYLEREEPRYPLAVKPFDLSKGRGATIGTKDLEETLKAVDYALDYSRAVILERCLTGHDFRLLVINNHLVAAACRRPAFVVGDGAHTVQQLVEEANRDPRRGFGHERVLTQITIDQMTLDLLAAKGLTPEYVPQPGEEVVLKSTANLSTGGTAENVTAQVHPMNRYFAEQAARVLGLDIAGIDIVAPSIEEPIDENGGGIVEVNAAPGFRMHLAPSSGDPINVAAPVIDMLFPPGGGARIPIVAVTGTNGKTTTARLIAHLFKSVGHKVGFTTTDGIVIGNRVILKGDMTGPYSARVVLRDPTVDFAVLETARGGILRAGLGFDRCDIGVVLNVGIDHLGLKDVETVEEMASVKSVVVENVEVNGYSVLNAMDPLVAAMAVKARGQKVFFSTDPEHPVFRQHVREGGIGATADMGMLMITRGTLRLPIAEIYEIPITFNGRADFNVENCLASALAAYVWGMKTEDIRAGLMTFTPTYAYNQGRMNLIPVKDFEVILDYCHNVSSYEAMKKFLSRVKAKRRIGVMGVPGDRRDEDVRSMATSVSQCFDHYVLRDDHLRGRKPGEVPAIFAETLKAGGVPEGKIETVLDEVESVTRGLELARKDDLLVVFVNKVEPVYHRIMEFKKAVENT